MVVVIQYGIYTSISMGSSEIGINTMSVALKIGKISRSKVE